MHRTKLRATPNAQKYKNIKYEVS